MGLSILHGIVLSYGGSIACASKPGEGTVFTISLPIVKIVEQEVNQDKMIEATPQGKGHILLVDDEEMLADMVRKRLQHPSYHLTTRTKSLDALATRQKQPDQFDLVITDQTMRAMTGVQLSKSHSPDEPGYAYYNLYRQQQPHF